MGNKKRGWYASEMQTWTPEYKNQILQLYGAEGLTPNTYKWLTEHKDATPDQVIPQRDYSGVYFLSDSDDMIKSSFGDNKGVNAGVSTGYHPIGANGSAPLGHAGNLLIDSKGNLVIYDYGRFNSHLYGKSNGKAGNVRKFEYGNIANIPGSINEDGSLNMKVITTFLGKKWANNRQIHYGQGRASYDEAKNYWETLANNTNRDAYSAVGNNCTSTACRAAQIGTIQTGTPGNEGFWIPRQGQAMTAFMTHSSDNPGHIGPNDVGAVLWGTIPKIAQGTIDLGRAAYNGIKSIFRKQGGVINYLDYIQ